MRIGVNGAREDCEQSRKRRLGTERMVSEGQLRDCRWKRRSRWLVCLWPKLIPGSSLPPDVWALPMLISFLRLVRGCVPLRCQTASCRRCLWRPRKNETRGSARHFFSRYLSAVVRRSCGSTAESSVVRGPAGRPERSGAAPEDRSNKRTRIGRQVRTCQPGHAAEVPKQRNCGVHSSGGGPVLSAGEGAPMLLSRNLDYDRRASAGPPPPILTASQPGRGASGRSTPAYIHGVEQFPTTAPRDRRGQHRRW